MFNVSVEETLIISQWLLEGKVPVRPKPRPFGRTLSRRGSQFKFPSKAEMEKKKPGLLKKRLSRSSSSFYLPSNNEIATKLDGKKKTVPSLQRRLSRTGSSFNLSTMSDLSKSSSADSVGIHVKKRFSRSLSRSMSTMNVMRSNHDPRTAQIDNNSNSSRSSSSSTNRGKKEEYSKEGGEKSMKKKLRRLASRSASTMSFSSSKTLKSDEKNRQLPLKRLDSRSASSMNLYIAKNEEKIKHLPLRRLASRSASSMNLMTTKDSANENAEKPRHRKLRRLSSRSASSMNFLEAKKLDHRGNSPEVRELEKQKKFHMMLARCSSRTGSSLNLVLNSEHVHYSDYDNELYPTEEAANGMGLGSTVEESIDEETAMNLYSERAPQDFVGNPAENIKQTKQSRSAITFSARCRSAVAGGSKLKNVSKEVKAKLCGQQSLSRSSCGSVEDKSLLNGSKKTKPVRRTMSRSGSTFHLPALKQTITKSGEMSEKKAAHGLLRRKMSKSVISANLVSENVSAMEYYENGKKTSNDAPPKLRRQLSRRISRVGSTFALPLSMIQNGESESQDLPSQFRRGPPKMAKSGKMARQLTRTASSFRMAHGNDNNDVVSNTSSKKSRKKGKKSVRRKKKSNNRVRTPDESEFLVSSGEGSGSSSESSEESYEDEQSLEQMERPEELYVQHRKLLRRLSRSAIGIRLPELPSGDLYSKRQETVVERRELFSQLPTISHSLGRSTSSEKAPTPSLDAKKSSLSANPPEGGAIINQCAPGSEQLQETNEKVHASSVDEAQLPGLNTAEGNNAVKESREMSENKMVHDNLEFRKEAPSGEKESVLKKKRAFQKARVLSRILMKCKPKQKASDASKNASKNNQAISGKVKVKLSATQKLLTKKSSKRMVGNTGESSPKEVNSASSSLDSGEEKNPKQAQEKDGTKEPKPPAGRPPKKESLQVSLLKNKAIRRLKLLRSDSGSTSKTPPDSPGQEKSTSPTKKITRKGKNSLKQSLGAENSLDSPPISPKTPESPTSPKTPKSPRPSTLWRRSTKASIDNNDTKKSPLTKGKSVMGIQKGAARPGSSFQKNRKTETESESGTGGSRSKVKDKSFRSRKGLVRQLSRVSSYFKIPDQSKEETRRGSLGQINENQLLLDTDTTAAGPGMDDPVRVSINVDTAYSLTCFTLKHLTLCAVLRTTSKNLMEG